MGSDEGMFEEILDGGSLFRVNHDHLLHEVDHFWRKSSLKFNFQSISFLNKDIFFKLLATAEGYVLMQHFIYNDSDRPDIHFVTVNVIPCDFRGHVEKCSYFSLPPSHLVAEAEIYYFYLIFSCHEDIFWGNVAMDESIVVNFFHSQKDLLGVFFDFFFRELLLVEDGPQFFSPVLHEKFDVIVSLFVVEKFDDIRVVEGVEGVDFVFDAVVFFLIVSFWYLFFDDSLEGIELILIFDYLHLAKRLVFDHFFHQGDFLHVYFQIRRDSNLCYAADVHIYQWILYKSKEFKMKAGKDKELDYLLINLCEQAQKPNLQEAKQYREKHSLRREPATVFGTQEYHRFGPGVSLYFTLLKHLVLLFAFLVVLSFPAIIVNMKGGGLSLYGDSFGQGLIKASLANQPSLTFQNQQQQPSDQLQKINTLNTSQILLILVDIICTIFMMCFVIYWRMKSEDLISEMVKKQALPSYHTIVVDLPKRDTSQEELKAHFQQFGQIRQVEFVYNYGSFLLQTKQFIDKVQKYSEEQKFAQREDQYDQIGHEYLKIKNIYKSATEENVVVHQVPFSPIMAFVMFQDPELAQRVVGAYRYRVNSLQLDMNGEELNVRKCHVEPLSIIWENYHLPSCSQLKRSWLFGLLVAGILLITLFSIFLMSLHTSQKDDDYDLDLLGQIDYQTAANATDPKIITTFCANLNYETFQWKFYHLCEPYFNNFQHHWAFVLSISGVIVGINLLLIKIVFTLAELRRFRTLPEKKRFLTISIFVMYFFSSSLLAILIRGEIQIGDTSLSLVRIAQSLFPSVPSVEVYAHAGRKWYMHIGKLLIVNYILTLIICPWLYVVEEWLMRKIRVCWSALARTQKQAKARILDPQFYWQFYYAIQMNAIFFGLMFSVAMPIFYLLTLISISSLFLTSKIIFHRFTKQPQVYDHKMNSFITRAIAIALLLHQGTSYYFLSVEEIFPSHDKLIVSKKMLRGIYIVMACVGLGLVFFWKKVASVVKKKSRSKKDELMITQEINSSFGAGSRELKEFEPKFQKKKHKISLVHQHRRDNYLNSYQMQDNPYYNNISYTLLILYQTIVERKEASVETTNLIPKKVFQTRRERQEREKGHQSLNEGPSERIIEHQLQGTERILNQSI